uniref:Phosphoprotein n=1 Tax=Tahe rhabdovirus 1 TaxID=2983974 RepID=A0A977XUC7_9RHAB|nr:phosphoprotein [Tahe rhabdovirus 1]WNK16412.1 MAG: phosphoprotein [Manly virus]
MSSDSEASDFIDDPHAFFAGLDPDALEELDRAAVLQGQSEAAEKLPSAGHTDDPARERVPGYNELLVVPLDQPQAELTQATLEELGLEQFEWEGETEEMALRESIAIRKFAEDLVEKKAIHLESVDVVKNKVVAKYRPFRAALSSDSSSGGELRSKSVAKASKPAPAAAPPKLPRVPPKPVQTPSASSTPSTLTPSSDDQTAALGFCNTKVLMKGYGGSQIAVQLSNYDCSPALAAQYTAHSGRESWMLDPAVPVDKKVYWLLTQHRKASKVLNALSPLAYP